MNAAEQVAGVVATTTLSSQADNPATLWPPPRTVTGSPSPRANLTVLITSATAEQRMISAGCRPVTWFQVCRALS